NTCGDGITVKSDQQIEKCGPVADLDTFRTRQGTENFLGIIERVELSLLKCKSRIIFKVLECHRILLCQRIFPADENMRHCLEELIEQKPLVLHQLQKHLLIESTDIHDANLACQVFHIIDDFIRPCLPDCELVFISAIFADRLDESIHYE